MPKATRPARSGASIRVILGTFLAALAILLAATAAALGFAAMSLHDATLWLGRSIENLRAAEALQGQLMVYYRLRDGQAGPSNDSTSPALYATRASLNRWMAEAGQTVDTPEEAKLLQQMSDRIRAYLAAEDESVKLPLPERIAAAGPALDAASASIADFAQINLKQAYEAKAQATRHDRLVSMVGTALIVLSVVGILSALFVYRYLTRSLGSVRKAVTRYRSGDATARAPVSGPAEVREMAQAFNELVASRALAEDGRVLTIAPSAERDAGR